MEYNEDTELFLYKLKLHIEDIRLRTRSPVVVAERGFVESLERLDETDTTYTGHFSVRTFIDGGLIEQWVLTISKGKHPKIVKIDQMVGDGVFRNRLKPLVRQFRDEGMSKTEANKAAYETLLEESQRVVEEHPEWLIKNTP